MIVLISYQPVSDLPWLSHIFSNDSIFLLYIPQFKSFWSLITINSSQWLKERYVRLYRTIFDSIPINLQLQFQSHTHRHIDRWPLTNNSIAQVCLAYSGGLDTSCICMDSPLSTTPIAVTDTQLQWSTSSKRAMRSFVSVSRDSAIFLKIKY